MPTHFFNKTSLLTCGVIKNLHCAVLFNPQLAHNDVVHATIHVGPGVRVAVTAKVEVLQENSVQCKVFAGFTDMCASEHRYC